MPTRLAPLRHPAVLFAHRGARANAPENTIEAFSLALQLGATGLESDVWITADGEAVLDHDGVVRSGMRRRPISSFTRSELPPHIPTLTELYETCGTEFELSLDVKDPSAFEATVKAGRTAGAIERMWLCHPELELLRGWRTESQAVRLVHSTRIPDFDQSPERHASRLRDLHIDAVNLHHSEWTGGLTTLFHRFGRLTLGWDAQHVRVIAALLDRGIDGVFSDHVDRLIDADALFA